MKTLFVLAHSHTDIGYTAFQYQIKMWQIDYIHQALKIINDPEYPEFKWNCEVFWAVEKFWQEASSEAKDDFLAAVRNDRIGISGNYLNFTELIGFDILDNVVARAQTFAQQHQLNLDSAMAADINGFGWGFSQNLYDHGITNFFTCIHTHHGMYPLFRKQIPFWWETPENDKILVWNGDHYHLGNELGLAPAAVSSYQIKDECDAEMIYHDHWKVAEKRIPRYFAQLEKENYPYNFVPVMVSGLRTDNSPPSAEICKMIQRWNSIYGKKIRIQMVTLSEFFSILRNQQKEIPLFRGDWPDWWTDGTISSPGSTAIFRKAQRDLEMYLSLQDSFPEAFAADPRSIIDDLALYAEHTFSHSCSVLTPWSLKTKLISSLKRNYAISALTECSRLLDLGYLNLGMAVAQPGVPLNFQVINPYPVGFSSFFSLNVENYEYYELNLDKEIRITADDSELTYQKSITSEGIQYLVYLELKPKEIRSMKIEWISNNRQNGRMISNCDLRGSDGVQDINTENIIPFGSNSLLRNEQVEISWDEQGISSWKDMKSGNDLLIHLNPYRAFNPIYEISSDRQGIGRNRKQADVRRYIGRLIKAQQLESGELFQQIELTFQCRGMSYYKLIITAFRNIPRVDVNVRLHKDSISQPENLYLALPFNEPFDDDIWLGKTNTLIKPWVDQLPGTLTDFLTVQSGLLIRKQNFDLVIACPDNPIVQLGDLDFKDRLLMGMKALESEPKHLLSWIMTNYWETNFEAELGGFYQFRYSLSWGDRIEDFSDFRQRIREIDHSIKTFRTTREKL